jgi:OOP family OmpA-OmpF porin
MKKLLVKSFAAVILSVLTSTAAFATHDKGAYVEANVGAGYATATADFFGYTKSRSESAAGANINGGYLFNRYVGAELGYTYYGGNVDLSMGNIAVKGVLPLNDQFNLFAKVGSGYIGSNKGDNGNSSDHWAGVYGAGVGYALTPSLDLNVQYQGSWLWVGFGSLNTGLFSGGVTYHF